MELQRCTAFLKAVVTVVADDEVVEKLDAEQFAGGGQACGERAVVRAGQVVS